MEFGKANYTKTSQYENERTPIYKFKFSGNDAITTLVLRFAPPVKELVSNPNGYKKYHAIHWGYTFPVTKKDGTAANIPAPFKCVEVTDRNKEVLQRCPKCDEIASYQKKLDDETALLKTHGKSDEEIKDLTSEWSKWIYNNRRDGKYYWIAKDQTNKWGHAILSGTASKMIEAQLEAMAQEGLDGLSPSEGVWFSISSSDRGRTYTVKPLRTGGINGTVKTDALTEADEKALETLPGLLHVVREISLDDVKALVDSKGNEDVVSLIFNKGRTNTRNSTPVATPPPAPVAMKGVRPVASAPVPAPAAVLAAAAPTPEDTAKAMAEFMRQFQEGQK